MFPKIGRGIADLQFVYLHCEIEMRETGYAPICDDRLFDEVLKRNFAFANRLPGAGAGLLGDSPGIGARGLGMGGMKNPKYDAIWEQRCKLAWMRADETCMARKAKKAAEAMSMSRKRRSSGASQPISLGFGNNLNVECPANSFDVTALHVCYCFLGLNCDIIL